MINVAVIGGGIAGIGAAHSLVKGGAKVTLFERSKELGGDAFCVPVCSWDGAEHRVDGGVSDFNRATFTQFNSLLEELGVERRRISREAGFLSAAPGGQRLIYFCTDHGKITFWAKNPGEDTFKAECMRFRREVPAALSDPDLRELTSGEYLRLKAHSPEFIRLYFLPRARACFAMHNAPALDFPIRSLAAFWRYHAIIGDAPPDRMCLVGGMSSYCAKFAVAFAAAGGRLRLQTEVVAISRSVHGVSINTKTAADVEQGHFDHVVICTKPCALLGIFASASLRERRQITNVPFRKDRVVVHTDQTFLPRSKRAWGAFNLTVRDGDGGETPPTITFWQNRLAVLDERLPEIFVTLNPQQEPAARSVIDERIMTHPLGTAESWAGLAEWEELQGKDCIWFGGSYLEPPFLHENALNSGLRAASGILALEAARVLAKPS